MGVQVRFLSPLRPDVPVPAEPGQLPGFGAVGGVFGPFDDAALRDGPRLRGQPESVRPHEELCARVLLSGFLEKLRRAEVQPAHLFLLPFEFTFLFQLALLFLFSPEYFLLFEIGPVLGLAVVVVLLPLVLGPLRRRQEEGLKRLRSLESSLDRPAGSPRVPDLDTKPAGRFFPLYFSDVEWYKVILVGKAASRRPLSC